MLRRTDPSLAPSPTVDIDVVYREEARTVRRTLTLFPMVVVLASLLTLGGMPATATQSAPSKVLRLNWGEFGPETLDPQLSHEGQWSISGGLDYEGLTRLDEELHVIPGAAESWEFSPDGTTITFHLRDGLRFSDGVPVTAAHFVYGAERLCSPELDSNSASLLFDVIGCEELFTSAGDTAAEAARAALGVRALDDRTLEYRFERPAPYFLVQASNWSAIPMRRELVEAGGAAWWTNPATRIGNGPYRLVEYTPNQRVFYARNDAYWGDRPKLEGIEWLFYVPGDDAIAAYRDGQVDAAWMLDRDIPALEADPILSRELVRIPDAGTSFFVFNVNREPFTDTQVRAAFAYAFDRDAYCRQVAYSSCTATLSMIPPGLPGAIETDAYAFDPAKARQALADSSYGGPENLPEVMWYGSKDSAGIDREGQWLYEQFRQVLGVELKLAYLSEEEFDAMLDSPETWPQFELSTWFASTEPRGWFDPWRCDSELTSVGYCNPELDAVLVRADAEFDSEQRLALYEEAGRMLVADVPAIFAYNLSLGWLVKPYVTGYTLSTAVNGNWPGWMNLLTVDVERPA
jgi:oligopeptide transport system substrate-binding protein